MFYKNYYSVFQTPEIGNGLSLGKGLRRKKAGRIKKMSARGWGNF
jgi:hypothetical protein